MYNYAKSMNNYKLYQELTIDEFNDFCEKNNLAYVDLGFEQQKRHDQYPNSTCTQYKRLYDKYNNIYIIELLALPNNKQDYNEYVQSYILTSNKKVFNKL